MPRHRRWRNLPIGRKAALVIAIPALPLILTALLYFGSITAYDVARSNAERATQNRLRQAQVFAHVVEAESAVRGYLLGGDVALLDEYRQAVTATNEELEAMEAGVRDPVQRNHLPRLKQLVAGRFEALQAALESNDTTGLNSPEMLRHVARGAEVMRQLRAQTAEMEQIQARVLAQRVGRLRDVQGRANVIVLAGATAGVAGGLAAALLFSIGITRRLEHATRNMSRLADRQPLLVVDPAGDEIGTLTAGTERAAQLLDDRDRLLESRMQELEALTRELEAFSYSVSHDLRAPLRHIAGFAAMLQKSAGDTLSDQQSRYITTIVDAAARMGRLIDDLLAFSRTSRAALRQMPVDVGAIVKDVQQQLTAEANGRTVRWVLHALPSVQGDPAMLRVVFDNLLANAFKYTRPREHAQIEVGSRTGDNGETVVYVRDNGVGFDMQFQNKLFGVFQRLHSSDEFEGTGIGLATVRRIVGRHGGRTWAEGRPGEGATFYISLPTLEHAA